MTVRFVDNGSARVVVLEGVHQETQVEELYRRAAVAFGMLAGAKTAITRESRLLKAEETLAETGISTSGVLDMYTDESGGMPGGLGPAVEQLDEMIGRLADDVAGIEGVLQCVQSVKEGEELQSGIGSPEHGRDLVNFGTDSDAADASCVPNQSRRESTWSPFNEDEDDMEIFTALFSEIDIDQNGEISISELETSLKRYKDNAMLSVAVGGLLQDRSSKIDFGSFTRFLRELPRIRGERVRWAATLRLDAELARHLKLGDISDGLIGLKNMSDTETDQHIQAVCSAFCAQLPAILKSGIKSLKQNTCTNAAEFINTKFSLDGAFIGNFADLQNFHDGPEKLLGAPNPQVGPGIRREHCERPSAGKFFTTPNYNITTRPKDEYEFVFEPHEGGEYPHTPCDKEKWRDDFKTVWKGDFGREVVLLKHFMDT
mmetsp:Transcript_53060/g.110677  ORF Transcript_53060/g.110677 Transcript_53060/m.110677 type:complete len:430 (-) Transcript_53060:2054-3343(-)